MSDERDLAPVVCGRCGETITWSEDDRPTCGCDPLPDGYNFLPPEEADADE